MQCQTTNNKCTVKSQQSRHILPSVHARRELSNPAVHPYTPAACMSPPLQYESSPNPPQIPHHGSLLAIPQHPWPPGPQHQPRCQHDDSRPHAGPLYRSSPGAVPSNMKRAVSAASCRLVRSNAAVLEQSWNNSSSFESHCCRGFVLALMRCSPCFCM